MSVDDVLQSACQFWCNLMSHYQSLCPKVQQQNKTHIHFFLICEQKYDNNLKIEAA